MATAQHPVAPKSHSGVPPLRAAQGYSFVWRKLHSLMGIIPIGAFLLEHLLSNFEALHGPAAYGAQVKFLNSLPLVRVLEWAFIFLPILYHGIYGVYIWLRGQSTSFTTLGPAIGCMSRSAGPASSRSSTSASTFFASAFSA